MDVPAEIVAGVIQVLADADLPEEIEPIAPDFLQVEPTDHGLYVAVFPRSEVTDSHYTDDTDQSDIAIAVLIRQTLETYSSERVAELKLLARSIRDALRNAHPLMDIDGYGVNLWSIEHDPLWSPELLRTQQLFLSILLVTYRTEFEV